MKLPISRYLLPVALSLLLGACQSTPPADVAAPEQAPQLDGFAQLEQSIAGNELATAEDQLAALQAATPDDPRLEQSQRQLAEAYLSRSQIGLQKGDVNAATTALSRARALMPKAPALTSGVNGAIAQARKAELEQAEAELRAAEARRIARLVNPDVPSTIIELNTGDIAQMRRQLDAIASDIVNFNCDVLIEVPRTADYPWLANLLGKRVNRINPNFELDLRRQIDRHQPAQIVLTPAKS
ncbi:lipoprotein [Pseudomonas sp. 3A(2025)]